MELPLDSIVLETDGPDIPPEWITRRRNEPAQIAPIANTLAALRQISPEDVAQRTTANAREVLRLKP
jgi:TatD DNase family protein